MVLIWLMNKYKQLNNDQSEEARRRPFGTISNMMTDVKILV